ncbi:hypothetical protein BR93DRAFT_872478 [Coniochaeta sp. PMI_546]|nr:hypothetical protein BR93DRAFT_872478 [Coniochaeta sp. PMI_546]
MPLKRGLERSSCDFCFRRKIKCDRPVRTTQGFEKCSQCDVRGEDCRLDDSSDMRVQRRRTMAPRGDDADISGRDQQALSREARTDRGNQDHRPESFASTPLPGNAVPVEHDHAASLQYPNGLFFDDDFVLSNDSVLFLDQIFMNPTPNSATSNIENEEAGGAQLDGIKALFPGDDAEIVTTALHTYFDYAASYLPILIADAFWADFHANRCSQSLLYAVACRGMPFTGAANKWQLEQQLARTFREKFLEARAAVLDDGAVGLDDIEALALMIDFEYDDASSPPLHTNLGRLFLTHESLVVMMLQFQEHDYGKSNAKRSATLARASERRVLLYWHIYGLDAFHCLDRRRQSLIPTIYAADNGSTLQHEAKDYFDAILALAIIARNSTQALCSVAAKRKGVNPNDVRSMYEQLALWRSHSCPQHLRRCRDDTGKLVAWDDNSTNGVVPAQARHLQLRRAVLSALEINCTMQIEACVSASGLQAGSDLETVQAALQIDFESVRALNEMKEVCRWMRKFDGENGGTAHQQHSLVDLAPNILRNACAGLCYWACQRGIDIVERQSGSPAVQAYTRRGGGDEEQVNVYKETAQLLRDCVATAVSHKDTAKVLERLDGQLTSLEASLERL